MDCSTPARASCCSLPFLLRRRSSTWFIVVVVCSACFVSNFSYAIAAPVLPFALSERVSISMDQVQYWISIVLGGYGAGLIVGSPFAGWLTDQFCSRKIPFLAGMLSLLVATLLLCLSRCLSLFVIAGVLEGLTGAIVWTVGMALLSDSVDQGRIGQAMGCMSVAGPLASLCAPALGGFVFDHSGYYAVFAMAFSVIGVDGILRVTMAQPTPVVQLCVRTPSVGMDTQPSKSASEIDKVGLLEQGRRIPRILLLLRSPRLLAALWGTTVQQGLMTSFQSVLPLFVKATFGWTATRAGLIFLPYLGPIVLFSPIIGSLSDRMGTRVLAAAGFVVGCPSLLCLRFVNHNSDGQVILLCILLILNGTAGALTLSSLMAEVSRVVNTKERDDPKFIDKKSVYGQAYGLFVSFQGLGCLIGPLMAGALKDAYGWAIMSLVLAVISGVSAIPIAFCSTGRRSTDREASGIAEGP
ncbi:MFS general substrate transporter [Mytilinidion resinicola]|uniref:MFS general substrate transporter n=1 Tax=Mytilinidion resinicola TaxID=574789 RepID=A0A6A6Z696_9PEZI|nr:MFS general substrate transporter [Mytilinidion resinicola]KAF2815814.1 MFS general substrate transporter [Mytilinidion resinicola]